jgi:hypothetical protein
MLKRSSVKVDSSLHMCGEFAEIDLATGMNMKTIIVNESGEEPRVRDTLTLFTDTDSNDSTCKYDQDGINQTLIKSDRVKRKSTELNDRTEKAYKRPKTTPLNVDNSIFEEL